MSKLLDPLDLPWEGRLSSNIDLLLVTVGQMGVDLIKNSGIQDSRCISTSATLIRFSDSLSIVVYMLL